MKHRASSHDDRMKSASIQHEVSYVSNFFSSQTNTVLDTSSLNVSALIMKYTYKLPCALKL